MELEVVLADGLAVLHGDEDAPEGGGGGFGAFVEPWGRGVCAVVDDVDVSLDVLVVQSFVLLVMVRTVLSRIVVRTGQSVASGDRKSVSMTVQMSIMRILNGMLSHGEMRGCCFSTVMMNG